MKLRLLKTGFKSAAENMAIDEAVLEHVSAGTSPCTLRFYGWSPPAISIGYFQSLEEEIDLAACKKYGIDYVRRITGGGAVLHEHEVTYSIHIPETLGIVPVGILESYKKICGGILRGLSSNFRLKPEFVPLNDIVVQINGGVKKISGNAQTRKKGVILQHGTILTKVDVEKMFEILKVPSEKLKGKLISDVKERVTGVSSALGREVSPEEVINALEKGFREEFPELEFELGTSSETELSLAENLMREKYLNDSWNKKR